MNTTQSVQMIDTAGNRHTMEITATGMTLDGTPCQINVKETQIALMSADPADGIVTIAPAAFWHAVAGSDPTPESAGLIQAQALAHWAAMQELPGVLQRLRQFVDDMDRQLLHFGAAPLPAYRFDPFTLQLLRTYDGTEEHIAALARLLKHPPETICLWLAQIGLTNIADHEYREPLLVATASVMIPELGQEPIAKAQGQPKSFLWTPQKIQQLTEAFSASEEPSISAVSRAIAKKYGWPIPSVEYKIHHLDLPRQREQRQRHQSDTETSAEHEEVSQPVIVVAATVSRPIETSAEHEEGRTERAVVKACVPDPEGNRSHLPSSLSSGNFLWDVKIDGKLQRWPLDVAYGMFPFAKLGTHIVYHEQEYVLQQVSTSVIAVTPVRTAMQVATV